MIRSGLLLAVFAASSLTAQATTYVQQETATLRALDKITGRATDIEIQVGDPVVFGSLNVELKVCYQTPPEERPESAAYLIVKSTQPVAVESMNDAVAATDVETVSDDNPELFSGWMFASSPGLSALEHPVYDIWVIQCAETVVATDADIRAGQSDEDDEDNLDIR